MKQLKIPYGVANFSDLRQRHNLYIDKTKHIEDLEGVAQYVFFIRPRRFGKSLFLSMLECYYDIKRSQQFEQLFGDLYVGGNPTPEKNQYLILSFDFSGIVTNQGIERFYESFDKYISGRVNSFINIYEEYLGVNELPLTERKADLAINYLIEINRKANQKLYILIDEYDNFANDLIKPINTQGFQDLSYETIIKSEGYVRTFYKTLKKLVTTNTARVFLTGVSPIMLDDLASGFNITTNITTKRKFNEMLGFTQAEVIAILKSAEIEPEVIEKLMVDLHFYYDGYLFAEEANVKMFNSDMFLYFLQEYLDTGKYPKQILDNNVKTDYRKLQTIAFNFKDEITIETLIKEGEIESQLVDRFELEKMYDNINNFKSLLFYLGMLTIKGFNDRGELILQIPNYVSRKIYWEYLAANLQQTSELRSNEIIDKIATLRYNGNINPFIEYVRQILEKLSNRDLQKFDERYIKAIMFTLLDIDGFYLLQSEAEVRNGYADMLLTRSRQYAQYIKFEWLIELKYIKESERKKLNAYRKNGKVQLQEYAQSEDIIKRFQNDNFRKALVCFVGKGDAYVDEI